MQLSKALLPSLVLLAVAATGAFGIGLKDEKTGQMLEFGGYMQYRGRYYDLDLVKSGDQSNRTNLNQHCYYGDLSLNFAFTPNENVKAYFELTKMVFLGQEFKYNTIQTGEEVLATDFTLPDGTKIPVRQNNDEAWQLHLRQAWMDIKVPGAKMKLKFGRQGFILGNGIYTNTNMASVFGYQFYTDLGEGKPFFRAGSMKFFEGLLENYSTTLKKNDVDDADMFFGDLSVPVNKSKLGVFLTYFRDNSLDMDLLSHVNLGLTANLALPRGWALKSEFDYQNGSKKYGNASKPDIDWSGWGFMLNAAAPPVLNQKLRLSAEYGIGSGDDPSTPNKFEGYVGVGPFYPYAFAYEYRFIHLNHNASHFYALNSKGMAENLAPGLENTTYLKATASFSLPKHMTYSFVPIYLGMTQEKETFGWEFDNIFIAPIYKNFSYQFVFAYFKPSSWWKSHNPNYNDSGFAIRNQLEVTF